MQDIQSEADKGGYKEHQLKLIEAWETETANAAIAMGIEKEALEKLTDKIKEEAETRRKALNQTAFGAWFKENYAMIADGISQGWDYLVNLVTGGIQKIANASIKSSDDEHKKWLDIRKEKLENNLIDKGFEVENSKKSLEAQLEAAKHTGDEVLIYQKERALEKFNIEEEAVKEIADAEVNLENKKNKIKYDADLQEYHWKLSMGWVDAAAAIIKAWATTGWPANIPALLQTAAATGAQLGAIISSKPDEPKTITLATGGIVPGASFTGDKISAMLNSREGVFTLGDQEYLFDQIQNRKLENGPVSATIVVMMDSREIAKSTVKLVNDGFYTIKARAIQ